MKSAPIRTSLSGPTAWARHSSLPVVTSSAASQPLTPISPPELPTKTLPSTVKADMVIVTPRPGSSILRPPDLLAGLDVDRDRFRVEQVVDQFAVVIGPAAKHRVAARLADRERRRVGLKRPLDRRGRLREVQRVSNVGKRRDQIHRVADDQRRALVAVLRAVGERPGEFQIGDVGRIDLVERAVTGIGVVARLAGPFAGLSGAGKIRGRLGVRSPRRGSGSMLHGSS